TTRRKGAELDDGDGYYGEYFVRPRRIDRSYLRSGRDLACRHHFAVAARYAAGGSRGRATRGRGRAAARRDLAGARGRGALPQPDRGPERPDPAPRPGGQGGLCQCGIPRGGWTNAQR